MASEQPYLLPRIFEVQDPAANQHVVMVLMKPSLSKFYPSKPWGTPITGIGLAKKDTDLFPDFVLVDFEPVKGSDDLFWIFQKLSGPEWTTKSIGQESTIPQMFRGQVTTLKAEQEVAPATEPTALSGDLISSTVARQKDTGKSTRINITEVISSATAFITPSNEDQEYVTSELLVAEGTAPDEGDGVVNSQVRAIGGGKAIKTTKYAVSSYTNATTWTVGYMTMVDRTDGNQNVIPAKFRTLSTIKVWKFNVDATAAPTSPALGAGSGDYTGYTLLERAVKQVRAHDANKNVWQVVVVGITSTTSSLVSYEVGEGSNRVTVTESLLAAIPGTLPTDTATDKYELSALGNGMYIQVLRSQAVFPRTSVSNQQPNPIPSKFVTAEVENSVVEAGTTATPDSLGTGGSGVISASAQRVDAYTIKKDKKTITVTSSALPGQRTSQWGILTTSDKVVAEGAATPHAAGVAEASVTPYGNGKAEESKVLYPTPDGDGVIASIEDQDQDPENGIITDIKKVLITNAGYAAYAATLRAVPWYVEKKGQDQFHSILIASKIDQSSVTGLTETFEDSDSVSLPDTLISLAVTWTDDIGGGEGFNTGENSGSAGANASASTQAAIAINVKSGFSGKTRSVITRTYYYGPPPNTTAPINIQPVTGSIALYSSSRSFDCSISKSRDGEGVHRSERIGSDARLIQIGPFLSGGVVPTTESPHLANSGTFTASSGNTVASASVSAKGTAIITLPTSSPTTITSGMLVSQFQVVKKWRLGVWIVETVQVYAPTT